MRGKDGFTLMELIIVMTIITIMSAAVIPVFGGTFGRIQQDHGIRDFIALLRYAQERAVADTCEYRVMLDTKEGAFWLERFDSYDRGDKTFALVDDKVGQMQYLPDRVEVKASRLRKDRQAKASYVSFYPNGACDNATVDFSVNNRRSVSVTTNSRKGLIEVEEKR